MEEYEVKSFDANTAELEHYKAEAIRLSTLCKELENKECWVVYWVSDDDCGILGVFASYDTAAEFASEQISRSGECFEDEEIHDRYTILYSNKCTYHIERFIVSRD